MASIILLVAFIFFIQLGIGGGLYETLVIYPAWKNDVTPANLVQKLKDSGQTRAARLFWPIASPTKILLAIINFILAWWYTGPAHTVWLLSAIIILISRTITFSYFIPTMLNKFEHPEKLGAGELKRSVQRWITLSPIRIVIEFAGWCMAVWALVLLAK